MQGLENDHEHDGQRVFETIQEAAEQLRALEAVPGLVILDAEADFAVLNQLSGIHESLLSEPWAARLAGVAVMTGTSSEDEALGELRSDTIVHIVPGVQAAALENTLLPGLRLCDREHLHSDPLLAPATHCRLSGL